MTDKQKKRKKVSKNYVIFEISNTQDGLLFARLTRENGSFQCNTLWDCLSVHALITIDLFTDTAAILSKLELRSIMGCLWGMSTFRLVFTSVFRGIFS